MQLRRLVLALFLGAAASSTWAAGLQVPEHIELLSINGQTTGGNLLSRSREYTVPDGDVVLELRYADLVPADVGDSHSNYRSEPVALRFSAEEKQRYRVQAERPESESAAREFAANPRIRVENVAGSKAVEQQFVNNVDLKNGVLTVLARRSATKPAPAQSAATEQPKTVSRTSGDADLVGQNLWYWWQQADEPTRRAFLQQIGR